MKLELTPLLNDWWNVAFAVTPRGLTSSLIPFNDRAFEVDFDFIDHHLRINTSDGFSTQMQLVARPVADFLLEFMRHLEMLDIHVKSTRSRSKSRTQSVSKSTVCMPRTIRSTRTDGGGSF